ncbi:hypothetical protein ACFO5R_17700 [Halosolutus amylolyticus]|uniref:TFIIS-type domain-containing protein n=1 Tax=Halosolutus amylolyticus TaxID=2932267 RepID=A0ABD5PT94_9EURY|nr:hypothetical protein [Halosolutus amylolyticus]
MGTVDCPNCLHSTAVETARETIDSGLKRTFECDRCDYVWHVVS